jgi:uncharacterized protein YdhG (YjbR/CyaY superfamily)
MRAANIDQYIAAQPAASQLALQRVRQAISKALPNAEEVISYNMPAFRLPQGIAIYFAGWKKHYSLYPATRPVVQELKAELMNYEIGKGTILFPLSSPVPGRLIARIAKLRVKELTTKVVLTKPGPKRGNRGRGQIAPCSRLPFTYPNKRGPIPLTHISSDHAEHNHAERSTDKTDNTRCA